MRKIGPLMAVLVSLHLSAVAAASRKISTAFLPCQIGLRVRSQWHTDRQLIIVSGPLSDRRRLQFTFKSGALKRLSWTRIHDINKSLMQLKDHVKRILKRSNVQQLIAVLVSLALVFLSPLKSNAAASSVTSSSSSHPSSVEYYLQNDPNLGSPSSRSQKRVISIQTNSPSTLAESPARQIIIRRINNKTQRQRSQRISLGLVVASLAAGSFRASLRKTKVARITTPFGIIRNTSPLGNGVSIIRLRMALGFADVFAGSFLEELQMEEYNLYASISMLAQQQQLTGADVYRDKQRALAKYLSNVALLFRKYKDVIMYGSLDSVRVPFVEEAVEEFRSTSNQERIKYEKSLDKLEEEGSKRNRQTNNTAIDSKQYVVASITLAIKGDHTSGPFKFGLSTKKDMGRALSRIATDAKVENCLVGTEVMWKPRFRMAQSDILKEGDILKYFPDITPLS